MKIKLFSLLLTISLSACTTIEIKKLDKETDMISNNDAKKIVIAHRGASGYLPEHSLASKAMAHAMDVDYIEQDVVMTKDDQIIVLHDPYLDRVTNVMSVFPERSRNVFGEKRWLAIDFTLDEIKQLKMTEGFSLDSNSHQKTQNYPNRFPMFKSNFQVVTLAEEIELIQGLNATTGKNIGIYVEIKAPWFHQLEGKDISLKTLQLIKQYGYQTKSDNAYIQCFDPDETKRINDQLMPELDMDLKLVQLIAETDWKETMRLENGELVNYDYSWMFEEGSMDRISRYADGIGPWMPMLVSNESTAENIIDTGMLKKAHDKGLAVHPYTFRKEQNKMPSYAKDFNHLLEIFLYQIGVDGVFTDFPDLAVKYIEQKSKD